MTYNILDAGTGRIDPLAEVVRGSGADVVIVEEAWEEGLFWKLAERVGMDGFRGVNPRNTHGAVGILTRWEIVEATNWGAIFGGEDKTEVGMAEARRLGEGKLTRSVVTAVVRGPGRQEVAIVGVHLHARETVEDEAVRMGEIKVVLEIAQKAGEAAGGRRPLVMCGDFNTSHPEQVIAVEKLSAKRRERIKGQGDQLPREVIGRVLGAGWVDAHAIGRRPEEFDMSFTTADPAMRVDFVFVRPEMAGRVKGCWAYKPEIGRYASDHYPVVMEMDIN